MPRTMKGLQHRTKTSVLQLLVCLRQLIRKTGTIAIPTLAQTAAQF